MKQKKYDVIIIGAGLGGLSVASLLAKQDKKKVLVLEQHYLYGGYATSFKRKGSEIDVSLHQTGGLKSTFYKEMLKQCGVFDRIKWIKHPFLHQTITPKGEWVDFHNADMKKNKKDIYRRYPKNKFAIWFWYAFIKLYGKQLALWDYGISNFFLAPIVKVFAPVLVPLVVFSPFIQMKTLLRTKDKNLQRDLFQFMGYFGDKLEGMSIQTPMAALYGYLYDGGLSAEGGGQAISDAFVDVIKENGGELKKNRTVEKILIQNDRAIGVKTHRGEIFYANAVISNANPISVFKNMIDNKSLVQKSMKALGKKEIAMTAEVLYLVLDCSIEKLNPKFANSHEVIIQSDQGQGVVLTIQSNVYGKEKEEGKTVLNSFKIGYYKEWESLNEKQYADKKAKNCDEMLSLIGKYLPGIEDHLIVCEYATPKTMEHYTLNEKGSIYGFANTKGQTGFGRNGSLRTKIKNLYFSSAWGFPGGGYEGAIRSGFYIFSKYFSRKEKRRRIFFIWLLFFLLACRLLVFLHLF